MQVVLQCTDSDSARARAKSHRGIFFPLIHTMMTNDFVSGQRRPWSDYANAQAHLGLRCPHMLKDTFSHGTAYLIL